MNIADLKGNYKVVSTPQISTADMNNPFNIKAGGQTTQYIDQGKASMGRAAPDGGNFLTFKDRNDAVSAAQDLLFKSGVYKGLTVDAALKKWSNNAYGGDIVSGLGNSSLDSLTPEQQTQVLNAMETKGENDAVPGGVKTLQNVGPVSVVDPSTLQPPVATGNRFLPKTTTSGIDISPQNVQKARSGLEDLLPMAGSIAGGIGGAALGGLAASPTVLGIPAAAYAGGVAGAGLGAAAGEGAKQGIQDALGQRKGVSVGDVAKTGAEYAALEAIGGPVASGFGKAMEAGGRLLGEAVIPTSAKEAVKLQAYKAGTTFTERVGALLGMGTKKAPSTGATVTFDKGLWGTESGIGVRATRAASSLWNSVISPALKASTKEVHMPTFLNEAAEKIISEEKDPTRSKMLLNALDSIKEDFAGVENVSVEQLQKYKEGWAEFVPEKAYKGESIAGSLNDVRNKLAGMARKMIYDEVGPEAKQAYLDYGNLQGIKQWGQKAMTGGKLKGGAGSFIHGIWDMATVPIGTIGGQVVYKLGQGAEFIGSPGARSLRALLGVPAGFGSSSQEAR